MKNILIIAIMYLTLTSCNSNTEKIKGTELNSNENIVQLNDEQIKNAGIETGKVEMRNISSVLKVNGKIEVPPQNMVSISVPLGGYLKSTKLLPGMHVKKGETIAVMEDQQYINLQQDYLTANAKLIFLSAEYTRQEELNKTKASSDKVFQQAKMDFVSQKILVKSLSEKLNLIGINYALLNENTISRSINIGSPIDGFVSKVNVNIGKYTNPSDILFELVNPTDIHLAITIFEKDISKLLIGQKLIAYNNSNPEITHNCEIILLGKDLTQDHSVDVHCHFEKYDATLIPGMFMNAEIELLSKNAYSIPTDAIVTFENKQFLFVRKSNKNYEMIEIKIGNSENGFTEIISENVKSLSGNVIVLKGAYSLLMKLKNMDED